MSVQAPPAWTSSIVEFVRRCEAAYRDAGFPAVIITSWWRDRRHNAEVGGHPSSQHLTGTALDLAKTPEATRFAQHARRYGMIAVDEGDHWHVQLFGGTRT